MRKGINLGEKNGMWKGDKVGYASLHEWANKHILGERKCTDCGSKKNVDVSNISRTYKRDISDWEYLCRSCHTSKDSKKKKLENHLENAKVRYKNNYARMS